MSTAAQLHALLEKHLPYLRYDSQEAYFADDAAIFTDSPGNTLQQANGHVLAKQGGALSLAWAVAPDADGKLPQLLTVTINSKDEAAPPATTNTKISGASGTLELPGLDPAKRYDIFVSDATKAGLASESVRRDLSVVD